MIWVVLVVADIIYFGLQILRYYKLDKNSEAYQDTPYSEPLSELSQNKDLTVSEVIETGYREPSDDQFPNELEIDFIELITFGDFGCLIDTHSRYYGSLLTALIRYSDRYTAGVHSGRL